MAFDMLACALAFAPLALQGHARAAAALMIVVLPAVYALGHLYRPRISLSVLDAFPRLAGGWLIALSVVFMTVTAVNRLRWEITTVDWRFVALSLACFGLVLFFRSFGYAYIRRLRRRGHAVYNTLIVGAGDVGLQVAHTLTDHPEFGLHPVGFVDPQPLHESTAALPVLRTADGLAATILQRNVHNVVLAFSGVPEHDLVHLLRTCDRLRCEVFVVPRLFELHHVAADMETLWGLPLMRLRRAAYRTPSWAAKRALDVAVCASGLLLLAPALALIAVAVRVEGGPGVLFRQERVGVDGRRFELLKFRSMRPATQAESRSTWTIAGDDRIGPVGRFLRRTSLDEVPQLVNVLRGQMSLVGPRPERPFFVEQFQAEYPLYMDRHRVHSGLTGLAQVHGLRGDTSIAERARLDNHYIQNWSLWLDVKILLRTVVSVIRGEGA